MAYDDVARRDLVLTKMDQTGKDAAMTAIGVYTVAFPKKIQKRCKPVGQPICGAA